MQHAGCPTFTVLAKLGDITMVDNPPLAFSSMSPATVSAYGLSYLFRNHKVSSLFKLNFSPFLRPVTGAIIDYVRQMRNQLDSVARDHEPRGRRSAFELWSGKVPLRPVQRIGLLLLNGVPLLGMVFFLGPLLASALRDAASTSILALCLMLLLTLLWSVIALAAGRWVWAALTAPSQKDE